MHIPADAEIAAEKLTHYLLVPRRLDDKSKFLSMAGFTRANPQDLDAAIRGLAASADASEDGGNEYGVFWRVEGPLRGPEGTIAVVAIWLQWHADGGFRFITLKPARS